MQVEHIIREENMMAAQEILELFCELVSVRLPIIESQRYFKDQLNIWMISLAFCLIVNVIYVQASRFLKMMLTKLTK